MSKPSNLHLAVSKTHALFMIYSLYFPNRFKIDLKRPQQAKIMYLLKGDKARPGRGDKKGGRDEEGWLGLNALFQRMA